MLIENAPKPEDVVKSNDVPSVDGEAVIVPKDSNVDTSDTPGKEDSEKFMFNGREYGSKEDAETSHKELQTAYQNTKAEKEQLIVEKEQAPLFEELLTPEPTTPSIPYSDPLVDESAKRAKAQSAVQGIKLALLGAVNDSKKPYYGEVSGEVDRILKTDPDLKIMWLAGRPEQALNKAYNEAVAAKVGDKAKSEYKRGQEDQIRKNQKPDLLGDETATSKSVIKDLKEMTLEEMRAVLPKSDRAL